ncbi:MAG: hypothetical protein V4525_07565 [Pseudomonadota bacterium]
MTNPYFVSSSEQLRLEVTACDAAAVVKLNGTQLLKAEKKDMPLKAMLTKGMKRSDKSMTHCLEIFLEGKPYEHTIEAAIYSLDSSGEALAIKTFKEKKSQEALKEKNISEYYLQLVQPKPSEKNVWTGKFYFQFD